MRAEERRSPLAPVCDAHRTQLNLIQRIVMSADNSNSLLTQTISSVLAIPASAISDETSGATVATWDSVAHLNLVMAIEEEFGVAFSPEEMLEMTNVGLIRAALVRHGK